MARSQACRRLIVLQVRRTNNECLTKQNPHLWLLLCIGFQKVQLSVEDIKPDTSSRLSFIPMQGDKYLRNTHPDYFPSSQSKGMTFLWPCFNYVLKRSFWLKHRGSNILVKHLVTFLTIKSIEPSSQHRHGLITFPPSFYENLKNSKHLEK